MMTTGTTTTPTTEEGKRFAAFCACMARVEGVMVAMAGRAGIDADELIAQTWVRAWERIGDLAAVMGEEGPGGSGMGTGTGVKTRPNLKAYVVRMAEHLLTDMLRREKAAGRRLAGAAKHPDLPALVSLEWVMRHRTDEDATPGALYAAAGALGAAPDVQLELRRREVAVERAIGRLPRDERVALEDHLEGRPASATAGRLGLRRAAAYKRLASARVRLAAALIEEGISVPAAGERRRTHRRAA